MNNAAKKVALAAILTLSLPLSSVAHTGGNHEVDASSIPTIIVSATADPVGGFNVQIVTTNFDWAPESASKMHVDGEGHAHIFLDGEKLGRVYGEWYHLNTKALAISAGKHELEVTLNSNDHGDYTLNGEHIASAVTIDVPAADGETSAAMAAETDHNSMAAEGHAADGHADEAATPANTPDYVWLLVTIIALLAGAAGGFAVGNGRKNGKGAKAGQNSTEDTAS